MFALIEKTLARVTRAAAIAGGIGLLAAVGITCLSIIGKLLRRLFNALAGTETDIFLLSDIGPILGEEELVQYAVGFALFTALPWLAFTRGHIAVDLLKPFFNRALNALLELGGSLVLALFVYFLMTRQWFLIFKKTRLNQDTLPQLLLGGDWGGVISRLRLREESQILAIKLMPLYAVAELCLILLFVVSVFCVARDFRALLRLPKGSSKDSPKHSPKQPHEHLPKRHG